MKFDPEDVLGLQLMELPLIDQVRYFLRIEVKLLGCATNLEVWRSVQLVLLAQKCALSIVGNVKFLHQLGKSHMLIRTQDSCFQLLCDSPLEPKELLVHRIRQIFQQRHAFEEFR